MMLGTRYSAKKIKALMAAPRTYGAGCYSPLGIRTFIIGLAKFFFNLSAHYLEMEPSMRNPAFILWTSLELMRLTIISKIRG